VTCITLTIADLRMCNACDLDRLQSDSPLKITRVADLTRHLGCAPDDDEPLPLRTWWDLPTTSVPNRWWSLRAAAPVKPIKLFAVRGACLAARRVLPLTREEDRVLCLTAIEAAEAWVANPCEETVAAARAAYSARAADAASSPADPASIAARDAVDYAMAAARATARAAAIDAVTYASATTFYVDCAIVAHATANNADVDAACNAEHEAQCADLDRLLAELEGEGAP